MVMLQSYILEFTQKHLQQHLKTALYYFINSKEKLN